MSELKTVVKAIFLVIALLVYYYFVWDFGFVYMVAGLIVFAILLGWVIASD